MKNALLILLLLILPWQAITAAERNFTHVVGNGKGAAFIKHFTEHVEQVLHHHHDDHGDDDHDGAAQEDAMDQSLRHLADIDHGFSLNLLLPLPHALALLPAGRTVPEIRPDSFRSLTLLPLLRPPRTLA